LRKKLHSLYKLDTSHSSCVNAEKGSLPALIIVDADALISFV